MHSTPSKAQWQAIDTALSAERMIEAVRLYREATGTTLADALSAVQALQPGFSSEQIAAAGLRSSRLAASRAALYSLNRERFELEYCYLPRILDAARWQLLRTRAASDAEAAEWLDELDPEDLRRSGKLVELGPRTAPMLRALCLSDCVVDACTISATDFYFADLSARKVDLSALSPEARMAWPIWLQIVDIAGLKRTQLPWWQDACARLRSSATGLVTPSEVRLIARHRIELEHFLGGCANQRDTRDLLDLIAAAAAGDQWVLGWEPAA